jgi:hypothetical protein
VASPQTVIARSEDPDGRAVVLERETWRHIVDNHPKMARVLDAVMDTVRLPDHREPDPRAGRERYFRRGGPERWIRVVTEFDDDRDRVVTAFPQTNEPASP